MGICPFLSGYKLSEVEGKEEIKLIEIECIKERCNFFNLGEGICVFMNINEINSLKKGLQVLKSSIHDELYDLKYDLSDKTEKLSNLILQIVDEFSKISKISEIIEIIISNLKEIQNKISIDENIKNIINESVNPINQSLSMINENLKILPETFDVIKNNISVLLEKISIFDELKNLIREIESSEKNILNMIPEKFDNITNNISGYIASINNSFAEITPKLQEIRNIIYENKDLNEKSFLNIVENLNKLFDEALKKESVSYEDLKGTLKLIDDEIVKLAEIINVGILSKFSEIKDKNSEDFEKVISRFEYLNNKIAEMTDSLNVFGNKTKEFSDSIFSFITEIKNDFLSIKKSEQLRLAREMNDDAILEFYSGNVDLAIKKFNEALKIETKPEILFNLASALSYKGEKEKAEEILLQLINQFPDHASSFAELGMIAFDKGKIQDAIELIKQGLEKEPGNQFILANLGYVYEKLNDIDNALKFWKKAIEIDPSLFEVKDSINFYTERRI